MSNEAVQLVLERTITDEAFRARLLSAPDAVLADYELTESEAEALRSLSEETEPSESTALDERRSKVPLWMMNF